MAHRGTVLISALFLMAAVSSPGLASVFSVDFENGVIGQNLPVATPQPPPAVNACASYSKAWNQSNLGNYVAQAPQGFGAGKVAALVDDTTADDTAVYFDSPSTSVFTHGRVAALWDVQWQSGTQSGNTFTTFVNASGQVVCSLMWQAGALRLTEYLGSETVTHLIGDCPTDRGLAMRVEFDLDACTVRVSRDGEFLADTTSGQALFKIPFGTHLRGMRFGTTSPGTARFWLDNVKLAAEADRAYIFDVDFHAATEGENAPTATAQARPVCNEKATLSTAYDESAGLGNLIERATGDALLSTGNGRYVRCVDHSSAQGTKLEFVSPYADAVTSGRVTVTWDMKWESQPAQTGNAFTIFVDGQGQYIATLMWQAAGLWLLEYDDGGYTAHSLPAAAAGTAFSMRVELDLDAKKVSFYRNNARLADASTGQWVFGMPSDATYAGARFSTTDPATGEFLVDNFRALAPAEALGLAVDDATSFVIYRDDAAPQTVKDAATDLQRVLQLATGVQTPIVSSPASPMICLGDNASAAQAGFSSSAMADEAYRIVTKNGNLYILGKDSSGADPLDGGVFVTYTPFLRGTRYGVFAFLEHAVGARWLLPGSNGEDVPAWANLRVTARDVTRQPVFLARNLAYIQEGYNNPNKVAVREWIRRNRLGGSRNTARGHTWDDYPSLAEKQQHPEYMALIDVQQQLRADPALSTSKLCTSLAALQNAFASALIADLASKDTAPLSPSDGDGWCLCQNCQALWRDSGAWNDYCGYGTSRADLVVQFYSQVAASVAAVYPNKRLGGLLYASYGFPPEDASTSIHPNVEFFWAPRQYYGMRLFKSGDRTQYLSMLAAWRAQVENFSYSDYPGWLRNGVGAPLPAALPILDAVFPAHKKHATREMVVNTNSAWGYAAIHNYICARLLWDPDLSAADLYAEWLGRAYGPAAPHMKAIYDLLEEEWQEYMDNFNDSPGWMENMTSHMLLTIYAASYSQIESSYASARALDASLTDAQKARLDMFADNMKVLNMRLRQLGVTGLTSSAFYLSDAAFADFAAAKATALSLAEGWTSEMSMPGDLPRFLVPFPQDFTQGQSVPTGAAVAGAVTDKPQSATIAGGNPEIFLSAPYTDPGTNYTFGQGSVAVLRDATASGDLEMRFAGHSSDLATNGYVQISWDMMFDSQATTTGNFFLLLRDQDAKNFGGLAFALNGNTVSTLTYPTPGGTAQYQSLGSFTRGALVQVRIILNLDNRTADYLLRVGGTDYEATGLPLPTGSGLLSVRFASTSSGQCVMVLDNFRIGSPE